MSDYSKEKARERARKRYAENKDEINARRRDLYIFKKIMKLMYKYINKND